MQAYQQGNFIDPQLISTFYKPPTYSAATMKPIELMNLDMDLPMGVFNHDSNLLFAQDD
jgi:hypothetical protein